MRNTIVLLLAGALVFHCSILRAQDEGAKLSAGDVDAYLKVENVRALAAARRMFVRDPAGKERLEKAGQQAIKDAGLTEERWGEIEFNVVNVADAINGLERGGDDAVNAKETLAATPKESIAVVKARLKEISDRSGREKSAQTQARAEYDAERRGTPPEAAKLLGTWKFDIDKTVEALASGMDAETKKKLHDDMGKAGNPSYTFGAGNSIVTEMTAAGGNKRIDKGTYRLDGNSLFVKGEGRQRESQITVGMKNDSLVISMMGVQMFFAKQ